MSCSSFQVPWFTHLVRDELKQMRSCSVTHLMTNCYASKVEVVRS